MDLTNPALTTLFIALIYTLIKVVEHFLSKNKNNIILDKLNLIEGEMCNAIKATDTLSKMHEVYDNNRVPVWYVPSELLSTVRNMSMDLSVLNKEIVETMGEIKTGQTVLVDKLSDLINSQRLMTERLQDLVLKLNKIAN